MSFLTYTHTHTHTHVQLVVTGAASGIGAALVKLLRERGDVPIGVDVNAGEGVRHECISMFASNLHFHLPFVQQPYRTR